MRPEENRDSSLRRRRLALSVVILLFGLVMMAATLTPFGPSPLIGFIFGGGFVFYGTLRGYQAIRS